MRGRAPTRILITASSEEEEDYLRSAVLLKDGRLVEGTLSGCICIWNLLTGEMEAKLSGHNEEDDDHSVNSLLVLGDGSLCSGSCVL